MVCEHSVNASGADELIVIRIFGDIGLFKKGTSGPVDRCVLVAAGRRRLQRIQLLQSAAGEAAGVESNYFLKLCSVEDQQSCPSGVSGGSPKLPNAPWS